LAQVLKQRSVVEVRRLQRHDPNFPDRLERRMGDGAPEAVEFLGTAAVLNPPILGLICSVSCPGSVIIRIYEAVRALRDAGVVVCGGFHSPMERECLDFLVRGRQLVVFCPATGVRHVTLADYVQLALCDGRLVVLSPFGDDVERATPWHGLYRNRVVAALSDALFVPHAVPDGKVFANAKEALGRGQPVITFDDTANRHLIDAGAHPTDVSGLVAYAVHAVLAGVGTTRSHR
jgi:predicted Rossmann fold nucleotide-binding protein DprA/Smf involved in DNA uptake